MSKKQSFQISLKLIQTQFNKGLNNVKKQLRSFGSFVRSAFAIGTITAFGRKMVETGAAFENAMARVKAVTNATRREFNMMQKEAQRLGATTKYTATEAANALETLTRNGMSATQATKALSGVLELAQANSIELANAADIITNSLNMFGMQVSETSRVNDVLSSTAANSATDINLLYEALVNAAPAAHVLGFSIEETSAALGALANQGVKGANAGTAIRTALTKMADPKIIKKMKEMGVAIDEQTMKEEGLLGTVKRLQSAQLSLSDLVAIFSQRGAVGIQQLISAYDDFEYMLNVTKNSAGTTSRMFQQGVGSVQKEVATLKSQYESLLITISQKTSGAVRGAIKLLQNLVNNFKTWQGTVLNLASVAIPLLTKHVVNLGKTVKTVIKTVKTEGLALNAALGNIIGLVATLVTWIGTALYGAWNRVHGAVRDAKKEFKETEGEIAKLQGKTETLINVLQKDKNSLNNVVAAACELFPDFADEIKKAAIEAGKTGEYDKLISKLREINDLQARMMGNAVSQKLYNAQVDYGGVVMRKGSRRQFEQAGLGELKSWFDKEKISKELQQSILSAILDMRIKGTDNGAINSYIQSISSGNASLSLAGFNHNAFQEIPAIVGKGRDILKQINANEEVLNQATAAAAEQAEKDAEAQKQLEAEAARIEEETNQKKNKRKTEAEREIDIEKKLEQEKANIVDDFNNKSIDGATAVKRLTEAFKSAYEDLRNLKGKTGSDNKYYDKYMGLQNGTMNSKDITGVSFRDSRYQIADVSSNNGSKITGSAVAKKEGISARPKYDLNKEFGLDDYANAIDGVLNKTQSLVSVMQNLQSSWETLNDEEASFLDKIAAGIQMMEVIPGILKTINTLTAIGTALKKTQNTEDAKGATVKAAEAIAGLFAGNSEIPIAGIAIAAAGVAALIAALAMAPKFAQGGIVGGNSYTGDKNFARVNSGEMILNGGQQANLMKLINSGGNIRGGVHDVNFIIRGKDLYGTLKNYNDSTGKIRSNL